MGKRGSGGERRGAQGLAAFALSEAKRAAAAGAFAEALEWLAQAKATTDEGAMLEAEVRYRLGAKLTSEGQIGEAEEQFSRVASGRFGPATLARERVTLLRARAASVRHLASIRSRFGVACPKCDGKGLYAIATCRHQLAPIPKATKLDALLLAPSVAGVYAASAYRSGWDPNKDDALSTLMRIEKRRLDEPAMRLLGALLADFVATQTPLWPSLDAVVPVPTSREREARRGGALPLALAQGLRDHLAIPLRESIVQVASHLDHTKAHGTERRETLTRAWKTKHDEALSGRTVLVVDDILTTGTTLSVAAELLLSDGIERAFGVTLMHTERSSP